MMALRNRYRLVCRIQPIPQDAALEVLPLYQPITYRAARDALVCERLGTTESECLSLQLDGGLTTLLAFQNLATEAMEAAIQRGELQLLEARGPDPTADRAAWAPFR